jgi:PleD family two-component response regulator
MAANRTRQAVESASGRGYLRGVNSPASIGGTARCLVVDDDAHVRQALSKIIEGHGLATTRAGSGREAIEILKREGEFPLVISDVNMPEMDGIRFLR